MTVGTGEMPKRMVGQLALIELTQKKCTACQRILPVDEFGKNAAEVVCSLASLEEHEEAQGAQQTKATEGAGLFRVLAELCGATVVWWRG